MDDWKQQAINLAIDNHSWRSIAGTLGKPRTTVSDFLRKHFDTVQSEGKRSGVVKEVRGVDNEHDNQRVLLISDLHIPYHHQDAIAFLAHLKKKYNPTRIICTGDEVDNHALSYHEHDPDLPSAGCELEAALGVIAELHSMFPQMDILDSNHGSLVWRKAKTMGIPKHYIKSYNDVLCVGDGWKWSFDLTIDLPGGNKCYLHHGKTADVVKLSQQSGMCAVQGHYHEKFKIEYWGNSAGLYWAMQLGCLVDDSSYAFNYNNCNLKRPVIGTGLIIDGHPVLEPMVLDRGGRWIGV